MDLTPELKTAFPDGTNRFNDGTCDPVGRFFAGTMGFKIGEFNGTLFELGLSSGSTLERLQSSNGPLDVRTVLKNVTCTNGMAWTKDQKHMFFTDSWTKTIFKFDYDISTATLSNRTVFSDITDEEYGYPDGLCLDDQDGVWSARWNAGKVIRLNGQGVVDFVIDLPNCWNVTCCIFGGPNMNDLYVTSASSALSGDLVEDHPQGGDFFVVRDLPNKGVERGRFRG